MNPKVNGQFQHHWSWLIAGYLFLGGVGSGAYAIGALNSFMGASMEHSTTIGLWIGFPALLIGSVLLIFDLGSPARAVLAGMKPGTSWMARGVWIISIFMVLSFLHLVFDQFFAVDRTIIDIIAVAGIIFAIGTMAYTGILLGASKGIPFWLTGAVPVVFVVSAIVTGHFAIMLGMILGNASGSAGMNINTMALEASALIVLEVLAIVFYLQAAFRQPDPRESVERILRNRLFVIGYIVLGLIVPLIFMLIVYFTIPGEAGTNMLLFGAGGSLLGLIGGLILRQSVLMSGALPTLNFAGFEFRRIHRPKEPKPGIGMLPPGNISV